MPNHTQFLTQAIALSQKSFEAGNFPAGAVIVMHHVPELEEKALAVIHAWERKMKQLL
jgi:tRNA(Arg) A34 adenosine deaminase TadA